jgi:hypothetical protein
VNNSYKYENIALMPNIFAELTRELFLGKMVKRDELAEAVRRHHISNGGKESNTSLLGVAKKALNMLQRDSLASKTGAYGLWRIHGLSPVGAIDEVEPTNSEVPEPPAREVVGSGNEIVYAYTYPLYERFATETCQEKYQIKIGQSRSQSLTRVTDQTGTALPEYPVVLLVIRCEDSLLLETAIHSILELRGFAIADAPGAEWFLTNPQEIKEIWRFSIPSQERRPTG